MSDQARSITMLLTGVALSSAVWMLSSDREPQTGVVNQEPIQEQRELRTTSPIRRAVATPTQEEIDTASAEAHSKPDPTPQEDPVSERPAPFDPLSEPEVAALPDFTAPPGVDRRTEQLYERFKFFLGHHLRNARQQADPSHLLKQIETKRAMLQLIRESRYVYIGPENVPIPELNQRPIDEHPDDRHEKYIATGIDGLAVVFHITRLEFPAAFNPPE